MADYWKVFRIGTFGVPAELADEFIAVLQAVLPTCGAHDADGPSGPEWRLFFEPEDMPADVEEIVKGVAAEIGVSGFAMLGVMEVPFENWQENWRQYFKPVPVSPTLEVRPSWLRGDPLAGPPPPDGFVLYIEPGMAFGTGTHATTQLCLRQAETLVKSGFSVLDCGAGSAILAIAAIKLGASRVVAFDIDPVVEENARLNLELNDLAPDSIDIRIGGLDSISPAPYDVIFCNMLSREFLPLLPELPNYLAANGKLLLSGLLQTEENEVRAAADNAGLQVADSDSADEWSALVCVRRS